MVAVQLPPSLPFNGNCEKSHVAELRGTKQIMTTSVSSDLRFFFEHFSSESQQDGDAFDLVRDWQYMVLGSRSQQCVLKYQYDVLVSDTP
jgi:hypothetical protein